MRRQTSLFRRQKTRFRPRNKLSHAPDAVSAQDRGKNAICKEYFTSQKRSNYLSLALDNVCTSFSYSARSIFCSRGYSFFWSYCQESLFRPQQRLSTGTLALDSVVPCQREYDQTFLAVFSRDLSCFAFPEHLVHNARVCHFWTSLPPGTFGHQVSIPSCLGR